MKRLSALVIAAVAVALGPGAAAAEGDSIDLQALIDAAAPGDTIELRAGTYDAPITIEKDIALVGIDMPVIDAGGIDTVITVEDADVTIDGVVIRGSGTTLDREDAGLSVTGGTAVVTNSRFDDVLFGVFLRNSHNSVIQDNWFGAKDVYVANRGDAIRLWESDNALVAGNTVQGGRDTVFWFANDVEVRGNTISGGRYGLHFMYSDGALVEDNVLTDNSVGAFMMYSRDVVVRGNVMAENHGPSGYGIGLKDMDRVTTDDNRLVGNRVGMYFDNTPYAHDEHQLIEGNLIAYNRIGVLLQPSVKRNTFSNNAFIDNAEQVGVAGTGNFSGNAWSHEGVGNYWSDFAGYDADGDGIGDVTYRVDDLYNTLTDQHPDLAFFADTPAAKAMSLSADMFPILRPDPLVEDPNPLVSRPKMAPVASAAPAGTPGSLLLVSLAMLAGTAIVLTGPRRTSRTRRREAST